MKFSWIWDEIAVHRVVVDDLEIMHRAVRGDLITLLANFCKSNLVLDEFLLNSILFVSTGEYTGFVRVGPKKYFFPQKYKQEAANIYNMPLRPTDVFVTSYPRSGSLSYGFM